MSGMMSQALIVVLFAVCASSYSLKFRGSFVNYMSIQMTEAERRNELPKLPGLATELGLKTLVELVTKAGLADALSAAGPFTVFGPTDAAFAAIPDWLKNVTADTKKLAEVLEYHVLKGAVLSKDIKQDLQVPTLTGQPIRFNTYPNNVVTAQCAPIDLANVDKMAANGVLHELKAVMIPPAGNIVEAVSGCPVFTTLVTAVKAAGLVDALSGKGPLTLFAPTNAAFAKIDPKVLDNLLKNKTALTNVLEYHVASGTQCSSGLVALTKLSMLNGKDITIQVDGGKVKLNGNVNVLPDGADGSVTNGVVHAIDTVLLPASLLRQLSQ